MRFVHKYSALSSEWTEKKLSNLKDDSRQWIAGLSFLYPCQNDRKRQSRSWVTCSEFVQDDRRRYLILWDTVQRRIYTPLSLVIKGQTKQQMIKF